MTAAAVTTAGAVLVSAAALLAGFPERTDYVGHFLAGAGGTAGLLAVVVALGPRPWRVVAATGVAILIGVGTEATVFKLAIFDPVDLGNQSLGALVVACGLVGSRRSVPLGVAIAAGGVLLLIAGFRLAFA